MRGKWAVAGILALALGGASAAEGATYLMDLDVTGSYADGSIGIIPGFTPFHALVTWHTGPFSSGPVVTTTGDTGIDIDPIVNTTSVTGGGSASLDGTGFMGGLLAQIGLSGPQSADYSVSETRFQYPVSGTVTDFGSGGIGTNETFFTPEGGGAARVQTIRFGVFFSSTVPPVIVPLTEADFIGPFLGGGVFDLIAQDAQFSDCGGLICGVGEDTAFFHYAGSYTVTALAAAPEPASWALMLAGFGLAGAGLRARRRTLS